MIPANAVSQFLGQSLLQPLLKALVVDGAVRIRDEYDVGSATERLNGCAIPSGYRV